MSIIFSWNLSLNLSTCTESRFVFELCQFALKKVFFCLHWVWNFLKIWTSWNDQLETCFCAESKLVHFTSCHLMKLKNLCAKSKLVHFYILSPYEIEESYLESTRREICSWSCLKRTWEICLEAWLELRIHNLKFGISSYGSWESWK